MFQKPAISSLLILVLSTSLGQSSFHTECLGLHNTYREGHSRKLVSAPANVRTNKRDLNTRVHFLCLTDLNFGDSARRASVYQLCKWKASRRLRRERRNEIWTQPLLPHCNEPLGQRAKIIYEPND